MKMSCPDKLSYQVRTRILLNQSILVSRNAPRAVRACRAENLPTKKAPPLKRPERVLCGQRVPLGYLLVVVCSKMMI